MRILSASVLVVLVLASATACAGPRASEGQQKADAAIAAAGMQDEVSARYSCSGALPGREDNCSFTITVTTDDFSVLEKAAAIDFDEQPGDEVHYRGIEYTNILDNLDDLRAFEPSITDEMQGGSVSLSTESGVRVSLGTMPSFAAICSLATDLADDWVSVDVSTARDEKSAAYWRLEGLTAETPALFDEVCALASDYLESIDDLHGFGELHYQVDRDRVLVSFDSRVDDDVQRDYATAWFADHDVPAGLELDIY